MFKFFYKFSLQLNCPSMTTGKNGIDVSADFEAASVKLKRYEAKLKAYCKETGLPLDQSRMQDVAFGRSVSAKAAWANKRATEKSAKDVDKSGESGIIEMYRGVGTHRKQSSDGHFIIDKATYHKITNPAIKKGADIRIANDEWKAHLRENNASAVTIGDVIYFSDEATTSDVLEEVRHFYQNKSGLNSQYSVKQRRIMNEIDAKEYLLSVADKYHIPDDETMLTREQLESYRKEMYSMKERGEWLDEG